jgi:hypothetical protein
MQGGGSGWRRPRACCCASLAAIPPPPCRAVRAPTCEPRHRGEWLGDEAEARPVAVSAAGDALELQGTLEVRVPEGAREGQQAAHPPGAAHVADEGQRAVRVVALDAVPLLLAARSGGRGVCVWGGGGAAVSDAGWGGVGWWRGGQRADWLAACAGRAAVAMAGLALHRCRRPTSAHLPSTRLRTTNPPAWQAQPAPAARTSSLQQQPPPVWHVVLAQLDGLAAPDQQDAGVADVGGQQLRGAVGVLRAGQQGVAGAAEQSADDGPCTMTKALARRPLQAALRLRQQLGSQQWLRPMLPPYSAPPCVLLRWRAPACWPPPCCLLAAAPKLASACACARRRVPPLGALCPSPPFPPHPLRRTLYSSVLTAVAPHLEPPTPRSPAGRTEGARPRPLCQRVARRRTPCFLQPRQPRRPAAARASTLGPRRLLGPGPTRLMPPPSSAGGGGSPRPMKPVFVLSSCLSAAR